MGFMKRPFTPAETAKRFGVSIKALRLYEQHGLLTPLRNRAGSTGSAWRSYGPDQIARLHQILALKALGLSLASIGQLLASTDTLDTVLALQDQALVQENRRITKALAMIRAARAKLRSGKTLSIDDLATLTNEASMASKLTRPTLFHPAFVPHQHKYFTPEEIDAMSSGEDFDQEADIAIWEAMIADLKKLAIAGDPASTEALALGQRWLAQIKSFTKGDQILETKLRNMTKDAFADPTTAAQTPYSKDELIFLGRIFENLTAA